MINEDIYCYDKFTFTAVLSQSVAKASDCWVSRRGAKADGASTLSELLGSYFLLVFTCLSESTKRALNLLLMSKGHTTEAPAQREVTPEVRAGLEMDFSTSKSNADDANMEKEPKVVESNTSTEHSMSTSRCLDTLGNKGMWVECVGTDAERPALY